MIHFGVMAGLEGDQSDGGVGVLTLFGFLEALLFIPSNIF